MAGKALLAPMVALPVISEGFSQTGTESLLGGDSIIFALSQVVDSPDLPDMGSARVVGDELQALPLRSKCKTRPDCCHWLVCWLSVNGFPDSGRYRDVVRYHATESY
jgi:hypothetical protein